MFVRVCRCSCGVFFSSGCDDYGHRDTKRMKCARLCSSSPLWLRMVWRKIAIQRIDWNEKGKQYTWKTLSERHCVIWHIELLSNVTNGNGIACEQATTISKRGDEGRFFISFDASSFSFACCITNITSIQLWEGARLWFYVQHEFRIHRRILLPFTSATALKIDFLVKWCHRFHPFCAQNGL